MEGTLRILWVHGQHFTDFGPWAQLEADPVLVSAPGESRIHFSMDSLLAAGAEGDAAS